MGGEIDYNQSYFSSSELSLCSALIVLGFTLHSLKKDTPQKTIFIFEKSKELDTTVNDFWQRKIRLEPLAYFETTRYLKSRIYGE